MQARLRVAALAFALLLASATGWAASVSDVGTPGANGADGAAGSPGTNGASGGAGGDASAVIPPDGTGFSTDASNTATATGGDGGSGGNGGTGTPPGANGGRGGAGGAGGGASANATTNRNDSASSTATAIGGMSGAGGVGGAATAGGLPGANGAAGGVGGPISAIAIAGSNLADTAAGALGIDHTGASVYVQAQARCNAQSSGQATLLPTAGQSTAGGDVRVIGEADAGRAANSAGDMDLEDVVTGSTSGALELDQGAEAASGSARAGSAKSGLHDSGTFRALTLGASAGGGWVVPGRIGASSARGGDATAESIGTNDGGGVSVEAGSSGGRAFGAHGGDADSNAAATAAGLSGDASATAGANGGWDGNFDDVTNVGQGGAAKAVSNAVALGSGTATAQSQSFGGRGVTADPAGDAGGTATAEAHANANRGSAFAIAIASAGESFVQGGPAVAERHGVAHALATVSSQGVAPAGAFATAGGDPASLAQSSAAEPRAIIAADASGGSTIAGYDAVHFETGGLESIGTVSNPGGIQAFNGTLYSATIANVGRELPYNEMRNRDPTVSGAITGTRSVVAAAAFRAFGGSWSGTTSFDVDRSKLVFAPDVELGLLAPTLPTAGFDALEIHISANGHPIQDFAFTDPASALAALSDKLVEIDASNFGSDPIARIAISLTFEGTSVVGAFSQTFAVLAGVVPEPAPLALLVLAMGLLLSRRRAV